MGRRRSNRSSFTNFSRAGRDVVKSSPIAKRRLPRPAQRIDLRLFEDLRTFHPAPLDRPRIAMPISSARLVVRNVNDRTKSVSRPHKLFSPVRVAGQLEWPSSKTQFARPQGVVVCVRRKRRREVLHALGIAGGRGLGRNKRRRTNEFSEVGC